jgi:hypothetical protein
MKKLSKIISAILTAAMLLALLPAGMIARAESGTCGMNVTWELDGDGVLTISGTGHMWGYDHYDGFFAPWGTGVKSVIISEGVEGIGAEAFYGCTELESISLPRSLWAIENYAFLGCNAPETITVAEGNTVYHSAGNCLIETASKTLVMGCKNSAIPSDGSVTIIGEMAFNERADLTDITIPECITTIGWKAFYGCSGLTGVTIPASVTEIDYFAFSDCSGIETLTVAEGNPVYHSDGNCLIETGTKTLIQGFKNSVIPSDGSVTVIRGDAFSRCAGLTEITVPDGVTEIGDSVFALCADLTSVSLPGSLRKLGKNVFGNCVGLTEVTIPNGLTLIDNNTFLNCTNLKSVTIPKSVTEISDIAFVYYDEFHNPLQLEDVVLRVYENSYAHQYAVEKGFKFELIEAAVTKGDPDGDGEITVADALAALRVAAKLAEPTEDLLAACDIDGDGAITVADALSILRVAAKLADPSSLDGGQPNALSYIEMATLPKTVYVQGEWLDVTGGELTLYYNDSTFEKIGRASCRERV